MQENLSLGFANIKGANQPAQPCSLISTFIIRYICAACEARMTHRDHDSSGGGGVHGVTLLVSDR